MADASVTGLPFDLIRTAAQAIALRLLCEWFPTGQVVGREFKIGNLQGDTGESLSVNLDTGKWADFAAGHSGYDLIDLFAAVRRIDRVSAARALGKMLGISRTSHSVSAERGNRPTAEEWCSVIPPPPGTRKPENIFFSFDTVYEYTDQNDRVTHFVGRIEARHGRRKQFVPVTYGVLDGVCGWHRKHPIAPRPLYGLNRLAIMPDASVLLCEGEKSADAAQRMFLNQACLAWPGGARAVAKADFSVLHHRKVMIWPDNDPSGYEAANKIRKCLPHARMLRVDDLGVGDDAADVHVDDPEAWLAARLDGYPEDATRPQPPTHVAEPRLASKPLIRVQAGQIDVIATAAEDALISSGLPVFQRGESLVRPLAWEVAASDERVTIAAGLRRVTTPMLVDMLAQAGEWRRFDKRSEDWVPIDPPATVAAVLLSRAGLWRVPAVLGVITAPTLRRDGSVVSEPGYDPITRLFYAPDRALALPAIPQLPNRADAEQALELLSDLLVEFPFCGPVDRAVALSGLISPLVRGALGMVPLHAFSAPSPGSGKSYLADVVSAVVSGRFCPVATASKSEEEMEKRLGGLLLAGFPVISIDNVSSGLGGDLLCQAVERPVIRLRALGKSDILEIESRATIYANGNNLVVEGDMTRRTLLGRLDAGMERPEERTFRSNPVRRVLADRGKYLVAAMTITKSYLLAGCPERLSPIASYDAWWL